MPFKIFYSWQSKTDQKLNRYFIKECLEDAIAELKKEFQGNAPEIVLDMDTQDVPGIPNIPMTIHDKIKMADVYVADITFIFKPAEAENEGIPAPNVLIEMGYALAEVSENRIITVMNTAFGPPDKLPFDIKQRRFPIKYSLEGSETKEEKKDVKKKLVDTFKYTIQTIFNTELERQKEFNIPFVNWKTWESTIDKPFNFETTPYLSELFKEIRSTINDPKTVYRLCGLSGIGKTRMLFECFAHQAEYVPEELTNKLLYANLNDVDEKAIKTKIRDLIQNGESNILILDNCSQSLHNEIVLLVAKDNSKLSAITVSTDPEEKAAELDPGRITKLLILQNQSCKQIVSQILLNNFNGLQSDEQNLLVEFSSGVSFVATLMAENPDRGQYQPGTLTQENVVRRLLGPLYRDEVSKAVIYACSLFSKIGFSDEVEHQLENIALNNDLFEVKTDGINPEDIDEWKKNKFKEICKQLHERQLLEKKGRTYIFRPSPLAVRMAEEWWRNCTVKKFERILPILKDANLVESFCEQFRYLKHVENAKTIVKNLCDGFFSTAEVLNTNVGSRLFRSFVYVNPISCAGALTKAFLILSKDELEKIVEGRRNLVWALEKLCFRPETFIESTKVMAAFSIAENENIGNNATAQFRQLFHIQLPGTAASLEDRWNVIQYCLDSTEDYKSLGITAISSALTVGHFSRMGGAEDQGDPNPLQDYRPSGKEVYEYWQKAIAVLDTFAIESGIFQERAIAIFKDKFYGICAEGAGKLIIPSIENLINNRHYDRMEARTQIQFILNSHRVFDKYSVEELKRIFGDLSPTEFSEKFKIYVAQPSHDEYLDEDVKGGSGKNLAKKIEDLAEEFLQQKENWEKLADNFTLGHLAEGLRFGKSICQNISLADVKTLLNILFNKLRVTKPENRNISIPISILSNYGDRELSRTIFHEWLNDDELKLISFAIARSTELPVEDLFTLAGEVEKGSFPISSFGEFTYGWGLKHLSVEDVINLVQRIRGTSEEGKAIAFYILATWTNSDAAVFASYRDVMRDMILNDSSAILSHLRNSMDSFYYTDVLSKLLTEKHDQELATNAIEIIIEQANEVEHYYANQNSFYNILTILQDKYFPILWKALSDMYLNLDTFGTAGWHFKELLGSRHDYNDHSEGLLFGGNPEKFETIFEWSKKNRGRELLWIAELLPLFAKERTSESNWHPYAMKFINEFGADTQILGAISAKLGSYSWVDSVVPKLRSDMALFKEILDHPQQTVREWAQLQLDDVEKRIKWETNRDEDGILFT